MLLCAQHDVSITMVERLSGDASPPPTQFQLQVLKARRSTLAALLWMLFSRPSFYVSFVISRVQCFHPNVMYIFGHIASRLSKYIVN